MTLKKKNLAVGCLLCWFLFLLLFVSSITHHQPALRQFSVVRYIHYVDSGLFLLVISYSESVSLAFFLPYFHLFSFGLLDGDGCLFPHSVICQVLEETIPGVFLIPLLFEYNHQVIIPYALYLEICNGASYYLIYVFDLGSKRDFD